jgi:hypothetical protein
MEPIGVVAMVAAVLAVLIVAPDFLKRKPTGPLNGIETTESEDDLPPKDLLRQIEEAYIDYRIASSDNVSDTADRNLLRRHVLYYYGSYGGAEVVTVEDSYIFKDNMLGIYFPYESVAGEIISYLDGNRIYVWKDGEIFTVTKAYEQGILTQEDVAALADMQNNKQYLDVRPLYVRSLTAGDSGFRLEKPSKELQKRFAEEYVAYQNGKRPDTKDPYRTSDVSIARWYGSFEDIHFLWVTDRKLMYYAVLTGESYYGYSFSYGSSQSITVWVEGEFITMSEAYKRGVLTEDMAATIWSVIYTGQVIDME